MLTYANMYLRKGQMLKLIKNIFSGRQSTVINRPDIGDHLLRMRIIRFSSLDAGIHQQFVREKSCNNVVVPNTFVRTHPTGFCNAICILE